MDYFANLDLDVPLSLIALPFAVIVCLCGLLQLRKCNKNDKNDTMQRFNKRPNQKYNNNHNNNSKDGQYRSVNDTQNYNGQHQQQQQQDAQTIRTRKTRGAGMASNPHKQRQDNQQQQQQQQQQHQHQNNDVTTAATCNRKRSQNDWLERGVFCYGRRFVSSSVEDKLLSQHNPAHRNSTSSETAASDDIDINSSNEFLSKNKKKILKARQRRRQQKQRQQQEQQQQQQQQEEAEEQIDEQKQTNNGRNNRNNKQNHTNNEMDIDMATKENQIPNRINNNNKQQQAQNIKNLRNKCTKVYKRTTNNNSNNDLHGNNTNNSTHQRHNHTNGNSIITAVGSNNSRNSGNGKYLINTNVKSQRTLLFSSASSSARSTPNQSANCSPSSSPTAVHKRQQQPHHHHHHHQNQQQHHHHYQHGNNNKQQQPGHLQHYQQQQQQQHQQQQHHYHNHNHHHNHQNHHQQHQGQHDKRRDIVENVYRHIAAALAPPLQQYEKLQLDEQQLIAHLRRFIIDNHLLRVYGFPVESVIHEGSIEIFKCLPHFFTATTTATAITSSSSSSSTSNYGTTANTHQLGAVNTAISTATVINTNDGLSTNKFKYNDMCVVEKHTDTSLSSDRSSADSGQGSGNSSPRSLDSDTSEWSECEPGTATFNVTPDGNYEIFSQYNQSLAKQCARCKREFLVNESTGQYLSREECFFHWGKFQRYYDDEQNKWFSHWTCCHGDQAMPGCSSHELHVWTGSVVGVNGPYTDFVHTRPRCDDTRTDRVYAIDCEMSYTGRGLEVTKVTMVASDGQLVYEQFVRPEVEIVDYNTRFSGITEQDLSSQCVKTLSEVQRDLLQIIDAETILIGHGLDNDLRALRIVHKTLIDTSIAFPHVSGFPYRRALKHLTKLHLQRDIQCGDGESGHSSLEDSRACMELMLWRVRKEMQLADFALLN